jgi:flagellar motility protein MotE (MotC chaperone)
MAEEKQDEKTSEKSAKPSKLPLILVPGLVFVISLGVSSWMLGVFAGKAPASTEPVAENPVEAPVATGEVDHETNPMAPHEEDKLKDLPGRPSTGYSAYEDSLQTESWLAREREKLTREEAEIAGKRRELQALKKDIEGLLAKVQEARSERIAMMAKLYDNMDAEAVAKQIANMDDRTVVMLLPQMNTRSAAKIMALLEPKRAAQITTKLLALEQ